MKALRKDFYMEIRKSLGRFLSIFFIVAIGVSFFSGIRAAESDMRFSGDAYFDEKNLMDIQVMSTLGLTDKDIEALEAVEGIEKAEPGYSTDVLCAKTENQSVIRMMSFLPTMNQMTVEEGALPANAKECVLDINFAQKQGYEVGDTITVMSGDDTEITDILNEDTFIVSGLASSPQYIGFTRGSTTIGNGSIAGFAGVLDEAFALDVYTDIYMTVKGAKEETAFTEGYEEKKNGAVKGIEAIQEEREKARQKEIVDEAQEEVDKARQELADKKAEVEAELSDAWTQITDGQTQLSDAKEEIANSSAQLESSRLQLITGQQELDNNRANVQTQEATLDAKAKELSDSRAQYEALKASGTADEATLQGMLAQIEQGEAAVQAGYAQVNGAKQQFAAAQAEIDSGWTQYYNGQSQLETAQAEIALKEEELKEAIQEYEEGKAEAEKEFADAEQEIKDAEQDIAEIEPAQWYVQDRDDLTEYTGYGENADRVGAIGEVFPVIFFLVAALISLTTMTRMVEEQRTQIGTLKALGYGKSAIAMKFLAYAALATVLGSAVGVLVGEKLFPYVIITAYGIMYQHVPNVVIPYNLQYALAASGIALACTLLATVFSCYKELREQTAQLMRPPTPKKGKRVFFEKIPFLWNHLNFTWKSTLRNLFRYKKRFFMTIFGISGCMALLLVGFGLEDSVSNVGVLQYEELHNYDGNLILNTDEAADKQDEVIKCLEKEPSVQGAALTLLKQISIENGEKKKDVYVNVPEKTEGFSAFVTHRDRVTHEAYTLEDDGAILTEKAAKELGIKAGDKIYFPEAKGEGSITVSAVCENYMQHYVYMTEASYKKVFGEKPEYNCVYYIMKEGEQENTEEVGEKALTKEGALSVSYTVDVAEQIEHMLGALNIVMAVLVISAGLLAFVVLYNLNNINITERKRELATLKVLGFYPGEVSAYVYRENIILTVLGAFIGCAFGILLHQFIIVTVEVETAMFGRNIDFISFVYSFLITIAFSGFVNLVMYFKLKAINMVESLKSVE